MFPCYIVSQLWHPLHSWPSLEWWEQYGLGSYDRVARVITQASILISILILDIKAKNSIIKVLPKSQSKQSLLVQFHGSLRRRAQIIPDLEVVNNCFRFPGQSMFPAWCPATTAPYTIRTCSLIAGARTCNPISVWTEPKRSAQRGLWVLCGRWGG